MNETTQRAEGDRSLRAATVAAMAQPGKGLLAADESLPTIGKRFTPLGIDSTDENRRAYRTLLFTTAGAAEFISGVILFEETLTQKADDGRPLTQVLEQAGIVPGIKVDKGTVALPNAPGETITQGLDGLGERLRRYFDEGARFAKWRATYTIGERTPSDAARVSNAEALARYAALCQQQSIVPIVEPEVLIDGDHTIERCAEATECVLHEVFAALHRHRVELETIVLKPSMVLPGKSAGAKASPEAVADATLTVLTRTVPAAVPAVMFLSGGQSPQEATQNLAAINAAAARRRAPWQLSFSYGRALQETAMKAWGGQAANVAAAQQAFLLRARMNGLAARNAYDPALEAQA